jgi:hypothetical protein
MDGGLLGVMATTTGRTRMEIFAADQGACFDGNNVSNDLLDLKARYGELIDPRVYMRGLQISVQWRRQRCSRRPRASKGACYIRGSKGMRLLHPGQNISTLVYIKAKTGYGKLYFSLIRYCTAALCFILSNYSSKCRNCSIVRNQLYSTAPVQPKR